MADAAALVVVQDPDGTPIEVLHWDRRLITGDDFQPSERLILEAIRSERKRAARVERGRRPRARRFTAQSGRRLGVLHAGAGKACRGWGDLRRRPIRRRAIDAITSPIPPICATI